MRYDIDLEPTLRPYVDRRAYRDAMASMGATACLVTAQFGEERSGRTVTSVFSLSVEPPTILVSIDRESVLADVIAKARGFAFAALATGQQDIAEGFAGRLDPRDRFERGRWSPWKSGHPRLAGALIAMDCELVGTLSTPTHALFAGAVVDVKAEADRDPLIWHERRYGTVAASMKRRVDALTPATVQG